MKHLFVATIAIAVVWSMPASSGELTASDYAFLKMDAAGVAKTFAPKYLPTIHTIINDPKMRLLTSIERLTNSFVVTSMSECPPNCAK